MEVPGTQKKPNLMESALCFFVDVLPDLKNLQVIFVSASWENCIRNPHGVSHQLSFFHFVRPTHSGYFGYLY